MSDDEEQLETADIQGLVVRGYGSLPHARFLLLAVVEPAVARAYLRSIAAEVNTAAKSPEDSAIQIAFTRPGLERLELPCEALKSFAREFLEGMDDDVRAEALGDRGHNDPANWAWGHATKPHAMLMLYAKNAVALDYLVDVHQRRFAGGFRVVEDKETRSLDGQKEHFGFKDGISMPKIEGVPLERPRKKKQASWTYPIRPGEFVLGYLNEYHCYNESPTAPLGDDPDDLLEPTPDGAFKSLGLNGTYLVYREMTQDVRGFWDYLATNTKEPGETPVDQAVALGAKMVGRWPSGAPLITSHERDDEERSNDNAFRYGEDLPGTRCPQGAHIRRANPRDVLAADRGLDSSVIMVRKHQMIRRGRPFGKPVTESLDPQSLLAARGEPDDEPRGLHFICLVGHLNRQFEFVQRTWIQTANFAALFKDGDPIVGARRPHDDENANDEFTCPARPVRRKYKSMPQFTQLVGGAYFFLPSIRALRFIARS